MRSGSQVIGEFPLTPERRQVHRIPIAKESLGTGDRVVLTVAVDRTVVPEDLKQMASADPRALGVRVFRAYVHLP